jgi:peptidoglycan/xylan/chitin deacetylase (PgdA/CDA1 family)
MKLAKTIYYNLCSLLPIQFLNWLGPDMPLLPYQHTVSSESLPHIKHLYKYKNEKQFIHDLDFLLKHYKPIHVDELIFSVREKKILPPRSFLLSFDDGFREVFDIIAPILEKKGIPALFFINPAFIDNNELFYRCKISLLIEAIHKNKKGNKTIQPFFELLNIEENKSTKIIPALKKINQINAEVLDRLAEVMDFSFDLFLKKQQPFLSSPQLHSLSERGFSIGAHSINHPYYKLVTIEEQLIQTIDSCNYVNNKLGTGSCSFSFPHSDKELNQDLFDKLNNTDIPLLFGIQNEKNELNNKMLHRFNAERPEIELNKQIKGLIFIMWLRTLAGKNNVIRK